MKNLQMRWVRLYYRKSFKSVLYFFFGAAFFAGFLAAGFLAAGFLAAGFLAAGFFATFLAFFAAGFFAFGFFADGFFALGSLAASLKEPAPFFPAAAAGTRALDSISFFRAILTLVGALAASTL